MIYAVLSVMCNRLTRYSVSLVCDSRKALEDYKDKLTENHIGILDEYVDENYGQLCILRRI